MRSILPLKLVDACVKRRCRTLVGPIDFVLDPGGPTVVIGPNGAGKTTLLRMMHGLSRAGKGQVSWATDEAYARTRQAFVFQTPIVMRRTAVDNVAYPLIVHGTPHGPARERAAEWLSRVGLAASAGKMATVLSGGERQKLALARALIRDPEVLFLDEPCASLDGRAMREIEEILVAANQDGTRIVMSTHDMGQARRLAKDILFIHKGRIHEHGPVERLFSEPDTPELAAFLRGDIVE